MKKNYLRRFFPFFLLFLLATWPVLAQKETSIQIKVEGLPDKLNEKMSSVLVNRSKDIPAPLTEEKVQRFYRQTHKLLTNALQPYGYFKPQIRSHSERVGGNWTLFYQINPGPAVKVIHVDVKIIGEGSKDSAFQALEKNLPIKTGQILNIDLYQDSKDMLFNLAAARGYFDAKITLNQIIINIEHNQASIVIHFDTGPRYRFGATLFPPSDLNLHFLQRFLRYQPGEYYDSAKVQKTQQVMAGSGYFSQAVVTTMSTNPENQQVPIKVELTPVKPRRYTFGLGYGTDTGPRGTLGFNWIPINSYGHHLSFQAKGAYIKTGGQVTQNSYLNGSYIIPGKDPATDSYAITAGYGVISQATGNANSIKTALSYNTLLTDNWQQTLAVTYLQERYQITDTPHTDAHVIYPSGHWQYIHNRAEQKEKVINNGISATFDIAGSEFISKTNFIQTKAGFKALATFDPTYTRFLFRTQLGHTEIGNLEHLPLSLQLLAGGPTSIRGFKYNSIGPGRNLAIASGEIQQRVYGSWYLSGFVDSGIVSNSNPITEASNNEYKVGAGGGVVVLTPIGAVELALARPILNGDKTWKLEFSIGAEL